ncbi:YfgG family protein [Mixta intestinalis]|uniref:DUF2633 domain-containing protein n=1 Tax=Mixta intestinalis TaxID=1615494 RepID=A0A6P1Q0U5_9GAMM|nr:YfgG family protein [Mixta intestinalis]QHM72031.1 hypothetical protein C7M51_02330 [Mixta intestinalis]
MNSVTSLRRRPKTGRMTRIILLISFILLLGRLFYALPGAFQHYQNNKENAEVPVITQPGGQ